MRSAILVGVLLARRGGRVRALSSVLGTAVATMMLLLSLSLPGALLAEGARASVDEQRLSALLVMATSLPVLILQLSVGRLSSASRDRNLASLRLLGLSVGRTGLVSAAENVTFAAAGAAAGVVLFWLTAPLVDTVVKRGPAWFEQPLRLSASTTLTVACSVVVLFALVSLAPSRALSLSPRAARGAGSPTRPGWWRWLPFSAGILVLLVDPVVGDTPESWRIFAVLAGGLLTGVGLVLVLPVWVRLLADVLIRWWPGATGILVARRLQVDFSSSARVVAGLMSGLFIASGASAVLVAFESTPQHLMAVHDLTAGPQVLRLWPTSDRPALTEDEITSVEAVDGVITTVPSLDLAVSCDDPSGRSMCADVFVGTCDQLRAAMTVDGCTEGTAALIGAPGRTVPASGLADIDSWVGSTEVRTTLVPTGAPLTQHLEEDEADTWFGLFVSTQSPEHSVVMDLVAPPDSLYVITGPGRAVFDDVLGAAQEMGMTGDVTAFEEYDTVRGYRVVLLTITGLVLAVGLVGALVTAVDRAVERRRAIAALLALGTPLRVLRTSQLLQVLLPLALGLAAASASGILLSAAFLNFTELDPAVPLSLLVPIGAMALAGASVTALATLPGVGGRLTPDLLRRE